MRNSGNLAAKLSTLAIFNFCCVMNLIYYLVCCLLCFVRCDWLVREVSNATYEWCTDVFKIYLWFLSLFPFALLWICGAVWKIEWTDMCSTLWLTGFCNQLFVECRKPRRSKHEVKNKCATAGKSLYLCAFTIHHFGLLVQYRIAPSSKKNANV